jgi:hypothetical protein
MTRILVLYYSSYGHVRALAEAEAEGALSIAGTTVDIRRIPETVPEPVRRAAGYVEDDTPVATPADLAAYDGIIFGTPTRFGMMAGQMKPSSTRPAGYGRGTRSLARSPRSSPPPARSMAATRRRCCRPRSR